MTTTIEESNSSNLDNSTLSTDMTFNEVNVTTGKPWTRQELWDQWQLEKEVLASTDEENALLRRQLSKALKERDMAAESFLTVKQYLTDFKLRVKEHNKHFTEAIIDVKALGKQARIASEPALAKFSSFYATTSNSFKK
jgi:hypothetical protein